MQDPNDKNQMQKAGIKFNNFFSTLIKDRRPIVRENIQLKTEHLLAKLSDREKQVKKKMEEIKKHRVDRRIYKDQVRLSIDNKVKQTKAEESRSLNKRLIEVENRNIETMQRALEA